MVNVLGINLSELNQTEVLRKVNDFLEDDKQHYIVTPNAEIILASHQDEEFFYILNQADLSLVDGSGPQIAAWIFGTKVPRVPGADITVELLKIAATKKIRVMILNWENGLSKEIDISKALNKKFPNLIFSVLNINRNKFLIEKTITKINNFAPQILFNTLGFPYQEKLIYHNLKKLLSVKLALGIGGSFDFITGKSKRAPKIFRFLGIEWFWRLLIYFTRKNFLEKLKRIYRATFVFMSKVLIARFISPLRYRQNVACFLYKQIKNEYEVLLVEREDESNHWQLPQGGTDGEDVEAAGKRELKEEIGTDKFIVQTSLKNVYRYDFKARSNLKRSRQFAYNFKGQNQGLLIAKFTGNDQDIKINFWDHRAWQWIPVNKFIETAYPTRRPGYEKFLKIFESLNKK